MESKPKACCANCEWCDKNGYKCKRSEAFVEKWIFCTYYHGNGITPEQEIEQANKRIAELEAALNSVKSYLSDTEALISKMPDGIKTASLLYGINRALDLIDGLNLSNSRGLKANCTEKSGSSTPQFTAEEIDGIRKLAQFSGFMIANSIIAKCDAMLKGAEG